MTDAEKAIRKILERKWDAFGACASCGWHGLLYEYGEELPGYYDEQHHWWKLTCLSDADDSDQHRGVRIPLD